MIDLTRRELLIAGVIGSVALSLRSLTPKLATADAGTPTDAEPPSYGDYRDLYRDAWTWDRVVRGTHLRANCFSACALLRPTPVRPWNWESTFLRSTRSKSTATSCASQFRPRSAT